MPSSNHSRSDGSVARLYGWRGGESRGVARVVRAHGDYYHIVCDEAGGETIARKKKSAFRGEDAVSPVTGDFVRYVYNPHGDSMITAVLPRRSLFERKDPSARRKSQVLAVNFDSLFVMMSMNEDFSVERIERYLDLAASCGDAEIVVVITKMDLFEEGDEERIAELKEAIGSRAGLAAISSLTGEGLASLAHHFLPGRTVALVGSSGVGKSTFLNTLAGDEIAATQDVQEWSGKGRHTTTSRTLFMLKSGAMVVDTPGVREIGRLGEEERFAVRGESTHRWRRKE